MTFGPIAMPLVIISITLSTLFPGSLQSQERDQPIDFRGRSGYTEDDLAKSLFPEAQSDITMRGIGPSPSRPPSPPPSSPPARPSVALNVFFEFNSDTIMRDYYDDIDKLGKVLTAPQYSAYRVQIEGYTDSIGSDNYNKRLSQRRAESVKRYLIQHFAIPANRLESKGYGESNPIAPNDTPEGRDKNRRVEVVNLGSN